MNNTAAQDMTKERASEMGSTTGETEIIQLGDTTCGMSEHPALLLYALSLRSIEVRRFTSIETSRFLNCREQGFVLSVRSGRNDPLNLAFFTHRNSDTLCALRWESRGHISGGFRPDDIPENVFPDKWTHAKTWEHMDINGPISWIEEQITEFLAKQTA